MLIAHALCHVSSRQGSETTAYLESPTQSCLFTIHCTTFKHPYYTVSRKNTHADFFVVTSANVDRFLQGVSIACDAELLYVLATAGLSICRSVRPSVCHTLALCQNDPS